MNTFAARLIVFATIATIAIVLVSVVGHLCWILTYFGLGLGDLDARFCWCSK